MRRSRVLVVAVAVGGMALATATGTASSIPTAPSAPAAKPAAQLAAAETALVTLQVADRAAAEALIGAGTDLPVRSLPSGAYQVDMVLTGARLATLQARGVRLIRVIEREGEGSKRYSDSVQAAAARTAAGLTSTRRSLSAAGVATVAATDTLHFLQNYWWTSKGQTFAGVEVATTATAGSRRRDHRHLADRRRPNRFLPAGAVRGCRRVPVPLQLPAASRCRARRCPSPRRRASAAPPGRRRRPWPGAQPPPDAGRLPAGLHHPVHEPRGRPGPHRAAGQAVPGAGRRDQPAEQDPGLPPHGIGLPRRPGHRRGRRRVAQVR